MEAEDVIHQDILLSLEMERIFTTNRVITKWPPFVKETKEVCCRYAHITELPPLPEGLESLDCNYSHLESLPPLPKSLKRLYINWTHIKELPTLPEGLKELVCERTKITKLPHLPPRLRRLECSDNKIDDLGILPPKLIHLYFYHTNVKRMRNFPASLRHVHGSEVEWAPRPPREIVFLLFEETRKEYDMSDSINTIILWNLIHDIYEKKVDERNKRIRLGGSKRTKLIAEMILYDPKSPFVKEFKDHFEKSARL